MSVRRSDDAILLSGDCPVEDAEELLGLLLQVPGAPVDIGYCGHVHTAVAQVLLAARPEIRGAVPNSFFGTWVLPHLLHAPVEKNPAGQEC